MIICLMKFFLFQNVNAYEAEGFLNAILFLIKVTYELPKYPIRIDCHSFIAYFIRSLFEINSKTFYQLKQEDYRILSLRLL